jgi:hypothetical protein
MEAASALQADAHSCACFNHPPQVRVTDIIANT